jgi:predicted phosphate transport protein (TIGR00153 family)
MAKQKTRRGFWARLFPPEHDFYATLREQADKTLEGVQTLVEWLHSGREAQARRVREIEHEADTIRQRLAQELGEAFSTPIDREDIHRISRRLDEVMNYTKDIVREVETFEIGIDDAMREMGDLLLEGMTALRAAFVKMPKEPDAAIVHAQEAKRSENRLEKRYRQGVKVLFEGDNLKEVLMRREVYRHISNTADRIDECADVVWFALVKHH